MPLFEVRYEDVGFGCGAGTQREMSRDDLAPVLAAWTATRALPRAVTGIAAASVSVDDSVYEGGGDDAGDVKAFVSIVLVVEAGDLDAAEAKAPPRRLLEHIADALAPEMSMEGNWEALDAEEHAPAGPGAPAP